MTVEELIVKIGVDIKDAEQKLEAFGKKIKNVGDNISKASTPFLVAGGAITAALSGTVKAAANNEEAIARLNAALKATGQYSPELQSRMLALSTQMQNLTGVSDEAYIQMQAFGLQLGLSADQITKLIPKVADLSASTGVDLESAMRAAAMAVNGNVGMLQRYGIHVEKAEDGTVSFDNVLDAFAGYAGAAEAKGNTLNGQLSIVKETFGDLAESVGYVLIPIIKDFIETYIAPLITKLQAIPPETLENTIKFTALAGGVMLAVGAIGKIIGVISNLGNLFTPTGLVMVGIGAFILLIVKIVQHWEDIKKAFAGFYEKYIKPWFDPLKKAFEWLLGTIEKIFGWFSKGMDKLTIKVEGAEGYNPLNVGGLQSGGIVTKPTLTWIGEKGPEAVVPLNKMNDEESKRLLKDMLKELRKFNELTAPALGKQISLSVSGLGGKV